MTFPFFENIVLENDRVRLSAIHHLEDSEVLKPIAIGHPELVRYSPSQFHTVPLFKSYFENVLLAKSQFERYPFSVFDKATGAFAGSTSFGNISPAQSRLEIGWTWIATEFHGTGLNKNMKYLLLEYAFEQLGCMRVELKADARNELSVRAMRSIGATYEGSLRSHTIMSDGHRRDTVYYSILMSEWPQVKLNLLARI